MQRVKAVFVLSIFLLLALTTTTAAQQGSDDKLKSRAELTKYEETTRSAGVIRVDQGHWQIRLDEIKEGKMLKFIIHTNEERPISSRASFETLPIKMIYARSQ